MKRTKQTEAIDTTLANIAAAQGATFDALETLLINVDEQSRLLESFRRRVDALYGEES